MKGLHKKWKTPSAWTAILERARNFKSRGNAGGTCCATTEHYSEKILSVVKTNL